MFLEIDASPGSKERISINSFWPSSGLAVIAKLCVTFGAAEYVPLPAWLAEIMHVPGLSIEIVVPETEQTPGVVDEKVTPSPDDADPRIKGALETPKVAPASASNEID